MGVMTVTKTPRFGLPQWSQGSDPRPGRVDTNAIHQALEQQAGKVFPSGLYKDRPATNVFGSFFLATDQGTEGRLYYNGGAGWVALNTVGGGGAGKPVVINGTGAEGASLLAARADHTHAIPLATRDRAGAMASQWAQLCEDATASPTAGSVAVRDSGGRLAVQKPVSAQHAATKDYVDNAGTSGPFPGLASRNSAGQMSVRAPSAGVHAANRDYVDSALRAGLAEAGASGPLPGLMARNNAGQASVYDPTSSIHIANKRYTDSRASRRAWKTNIRPLELGLDVVRDLRPVTFDYLPSAPAVGTGVVGGVVEDVHQVAPELTTRGEDGAPERIRDRDLTWVLVRAVQELSERVDELSTELDNVYHRLGGDE